MRNVDMISAEFINPTTYNLYDLYSKDNVQPLNDVSLGGTYDLINKIFAYNNMYILSFDRLLITNHSLDYKIIKVFICLKRT